MILKDNTMSLKCPANNCSMCARLVEFRHENKRKYPAYHNAPVASFGDIASKVLIIGLAPGLNGANQTGRPFTGDYAGDILYPALKKHGFATGSYDKHPDDGFRLIDARITNAVRCVPPQNKVTAEEAKNCQPFLISEIANMPNLKVILTLGAVAHGAFLNAFGHTKSKHKFGHGNIHHFDNFILLNSYHTSRYNINTGVLTAEMFDRIIQKVKELADVS